MREQFIISIEIINSRHYYHNDHNDEQLLYCMSSVSYTFVSVFAAISPLSLYIS